jgi:Primase X
LTTTSWREKLLQTPIGDYRKNAVSLILAPYLINIKKLSSDDAFKIIKEWSDKCNKIRRLDSKFDYIIKYALKSARGNGIPTMRLQTLREKNSQLYDKVNLSKN